MGIALAVISAAIALGGLPQLPERGLALETKAGVQLQTLRGRRLATLPGLDLAPDRAVAHKVVVRDARGRLFAVDRHGIRAISGQHGCRMTDVRLVVCPHAIWSGGRIVVHEARHIGHWVWAERSPSGDAILAQWSAECEVPVAYRIRKRVLGAYGSPEAVALGWLPSGEAVIHYPNGACAGGSVARRGIYAVAGSGKRRFIARTPRFAQYAMWGG